MCEILVAAAPAVVTAWHCLHSGHPTTPLAAIHLRMAVHKPSNTTAAGATAARTLYSAGVAYGSKGGNPAAPLAAIYNQLYTTDETQQQQGHDGMRDLAV